jgi:CDP-diacylglycerol--serine O-phosphatidyltransferase
MRHLPNLLTLANLFCGCLAIVCVLNAQPFLTYNTATGNPSTEWTWVFGVQEMALGGLFIFLAGLFDLFDGWVARALKVFSPIGKDLDSLADVVSFGVAPSMILYKMLWDVTLSVPGNPDVSKFLLAPAFLIACFSALRLARFNVAPATREEFTGMPTPAVGIFVASLALVYWFRPAGWMDYLQSTWALYLLIALLCYLMISKIRFLKLMPAKWSISHSWPQAVLVAGTLIAIPPLGFSALPAAFVLYIIVSLASPKSNEKPAADTTRATN